MPAANSEMLAQLEQLSPIGAPRGCSVTIRNATTPDRASTIIGAGVHFFYADDEGQPAADYLAGPVRVEIAAGSAAPFKSSDPRRKVTKLVVGVRVRFGDKDDPNAKIYSFTREEDAPVATSTPPKRTLIVNADFDFRVTDVARFSASNASEWFELARRRSE